ncbi:hypothetical protein A2Z10_03300 [Candidatus Azambacteria bacterium RBG_16_47_10]|uniref:Cation-transporting P-type ATPase N-terminal domain-containing protein n=1 Tax=Candidatus Azambacteria bacterium RBG_16_47_10 TaxID=1797292 RepID=A0A1F5B123_9BACT|nr:MAG: hypothetical protein A2Z10_03300 [Candidatus Azambacteria bacterium RBG_16_47_10]
MLWHRLSLSDIEKELRTNAGSGLTADQAQERIRSFGKNQITEKKTDSGLFIFLRQFSSPLIFILFASAAVILYLGEIVDAIIISFVLFFNAIIGAVQEGKAQNTLSALRKFVQTNATVMRDGKEIIIPDTEIVPGDILILQEGEKIPADARVIESHNLSVDEAALTGESHPARKTTEAIGEESIPPSEQRNIIFKGTYVVVGNGRAVVVATGNDTEIGKISRSIALVDTEIPLKANIRYLSRIIIVVVAMIVSFIFIAGISFGHSKVEMFTVAVTLAVSIIPEGLPIVLTIVLAGGVFKMAKHNALVKRLQAVEALGQASVIAVDKTGTITKNEMVAKEFYTASGAIFTMSGVGYEKSGSITKNGEIIDPLIHPELMRAGELAAMCANAHIMFIEESKIYKVSGDPTEAALLVFAEKIGFNKNAIEHEFRKITEIPFDYRTKYHIVSHEKNNMQYVSVVGAPEILLSASHTMNSNGNVKPFTDADRVKTEDALVRMLQNGMRIVALTYAELPLHAQLDASIPLPPLTFVGFLGIQDGLREEVRDAVARATSAGISVVLITGDHEITALALAKEAGIYHEQDGIITGKKIEAMTDEELVAVVNSTTVFARVTPEHKLRIINAYKASGKIIAMTGDGINDAPSLVAADLGVAMGRIGTDVAKEAADIILLDDNLGNIVRAVEEGRGIYKTIKKVILYLFSTSVGEVLTIVIALFMGLPIPLIGAQIIWLNFVTDGFLDISLAMEPHGKNLLARTFEHPKKYLLDALMIKRMFIMAIPMAIGTLFMFHEYYATDLAKAMTIALTTLAIFQWYNAWNCRSDERSIFSINPLTNKYLIGATILVALLHVMAVYTPFMQRILHTVPLGWYDWAMAAAIATSVIFAEETRKMISNSARKKHITTSHHV